MPDIITGLLLIELYTLLKYCKKCGLDQETNFNTDQMQESDMINFDYSPQKNMCTTYIVQFRIF